MDDAVIELCGHSHPGLLQFFADALGDNAPLFAQRRAATASAKSIPAATPAPVMMLPSMTTRWLTGMAPSGLRCSIAVQWQVARLPVGSPAAPSISEPVHTEVTYFAPAACFRKNSSTPASSIMPCCPARPGTM